MQGAYSNSTSINSSALVLYNLYLVKIKPCCLCLSLGISQVTKTVQGMAKLSCNYNISVDELSRVRIYWQKENKMVLSVISGRVQVWSQYQNRTIPEITNNLSLVILALRLSDRGTYTCVVQKTKKGSFQVEHLTSLKVKLCDLWELITLGTWSSNRMLREKQSQRKDKEVRVQ
uniref:Ig-like domain-containing protein n=1 Tax=Spermophilus dauricus TaxID=99837 RepID=A0A8C9PMK3_SPEDA